MRVDKCYNLCETNCLVGLIRETNTTICCSSDGGLITFLGCKIFFIFGYSFSTVVQLGTPTENFVMFDYKFIIFDCLRYGTHVLSQ